MHRFSDGPAPIHEILRNHLRDQDMQIAVDTHHDEFEGSEEKWNYVLCSYIAEMSEYYDDPNNSN